MQVIQQTAQITITQEHPSQSRTKMNLALHSYVIHVLGRRLCYWLLLERWEMDGVWEGERGRRGTRGSRRGRGGVIGWREGVGLTGRLIRSSDFWQLPDACDEMINGTQLNNSMDMARRV